MEKKKSKKRLKKVCEIFKLGKKKTIKVCGDEEIKIVKKEQIKEENKQLKNILLCLGVFILIFILVVLFIYSGLHFEYRGIKFDVVKEENIIFYKTALPVIYKGEKTSYNFYLRNDPRELDVPVEKEINFKKNVVINMTENFNCDGDGIIAVANLVNLYELLEINIMKDQNASCDAQGRYMFVQIQPGNETNIEQFGPACYNLNVNNCEILEVTEQLMIETFAKFHEKEK